ncbi:transcription factor GTE4 isoform X1 [Olea europaea subsp. europaea]|uniref:Transcription factor GTE4 isoform X1 n=1 Tax=Olea europaea subsp. europaea TaxID=158383 RepID=A0A8S0QZY9_OLEEU|nr:transcription factor GTE4 isoform X1 [Olea europaea subsp. europaea]
MLGGGNEGSKEKKKGADSKVYTRKPFKGLKNSKNLSKEQQPTTQEMVPEGLNVTKRLSNSCVDAASDNFSGLNHDGLVGNGGILRPENSVTINLSMKSKKEAQELKRKLEGERNMVWSLMKKIEANEKQINDHVFDKSSGNNVPVGLPRMLKPLNQLSVSVVEDSQGGNENVVKEKRTNYDFFLAKDKFPSAESNKKLKSDGKKGGGSELGNSFGLEKFSNKLFKSCSALLERLMKHKHGWVFNKPVDTVSLGLHDYFDIIKNPMDLGSVKAKLNQNVYKSPLEFAEDVRLTFRNALTYNPKEQDVYMMAEQLSKIFENKWASIEADYMQELKLSGDIEVGSPTPTSRKAPTQSRPLPDMRRVLNRSESMTHPIDPQRRSTNLVRSGRIATTNKPKAKDPNKREMTFEEKQKLSINLQSLPSEKLENVVQIIKKRNPALSQCDDEIEVDIDIVDTETLWELDRFIANYKKSLSKNKRKAEIVTQLKDGAQQNPQETIPSPVVTESPNEFKENKSDEKNVSSPLAQVGKLRGNDANQTANTSDSNPDSGSLSSDPDSENTSGFGSDAGRTPNN